MNLKRLLIDRIENRILVGLTMILASMVLIGWVGINEEGRMRAFTEEHLARSIEAGNDLFVSNCATCHGPNGHGIAGIAPGLNNPQLFGIDFLADVNGKISDLQSAKADIQSIQDTLAGDTTGVDVEALQAKLDGYVQTYGSDPISAIDSQITDLNSQHDSLVAQMAPAVQAGYDPENPSRLNELGWSGSLEAFVLSTVTSGRPVSASYWPQPMPTWAQMAGGPLRQDQVDDITNFVMNWGNKTWTIDDLLAVKQFAKIPGEGGAAAAGNVAPDVVNMSVADAQTQQDMINKTVTDVMGEIDGLTGDPNHGQELYNGALGCAGCHTTTVGPPMDGTFTRVQNTRLNDPALAGFTAEQYLVESILVPNAYIAPGYPSDTMPQDFGTKLSVQDLADIVAFLESQDGPDPLAQ